MIKNYLILSNEEKYKLLKFINKKQGNKLSFEDMEKQFKSREYDFGNGVAININKGYIMWKMLIMLKESITKQIAYIVKLEVEDNNEKECIKEMLSEAKSICKKYGIKQIFLGTKDSKIISALKKLNFNIQYSAIKMILQDRKIRYSPLKLEALNKNNKMEYLNIYNDSFETTPNGTTLTLDEVNDYIKKHGENSFYYIVLKDNNRIGFLEFNIKDGFGEFDLGLIKKFRGKGYGKEILETAIAFLNLKNVDNIRLLVITKNKIALDMYKKRGFRENEIINYWFSI